ncbi:MAG: TetR/AcrR family transcriptional regulator [Candidatus Methanomethylophilaceae archaeon]|nr:TetR/AcrR family transcriptional regulator [Candidatus Methanomethylophilaceae archaeon]
MEFHGQIDRRQQKTRLAIYRAFSSLLMEKSFAAITVQDIIDEANVGRSTFYSHFSTKEDLIDGLCKEIFSHVFSEPEGPGADHDFSHSRYNIDDELAHILYHLRSSSDLIIPMISSDCSEMFLRHYRTELAGIFSKDEDGTDDFWTFMLIGGFVETSRWYLSHVEMTPESAVEMFMEVYGRLLPDERS